MEEYKKCLDCKERKGFAKYYDIHFDYKDCPLNCSYEKEVKKNECKQKS